MKTRLDNDMIDCISTIYDENETKLFWLIEPGVVWEKNWTGQRCDRLYRCGLQK